MDSIPPVAAQSDLDAAFEWLTAALRTLEVEGARPVGARLKLALRRTSAGAFDEKRLGFAKFGEFLRLAESRGLVSLRTEPGKDVVVVSLGRPPHDTASRQLVDGRFLRNDLWRAFMYPKPERIAVFDRSAGRAVSYSLGETSNATNSEVRQAVVTDPERFVPITPVAQDRVITWMHDFASSYQDSADSHVMSDSLAGGGKSAFDELMARRKDLGDQWNHYRLGRLFELVAEWARLNGLAIPLLLPKRRAPSRDEAVDEQSATPFAPSADWLIDADLLRSRLHAAIDRMSRRELLRIAVPLEFLTES